MTKPREEMRDDGMMADKDIGARRHVNKTNEPPPANPLINSPRITARYRSLISRSDHSTLLLIWNRHSRNTCRQPGISAYPARSTIGLRRELKIKILAFDLDRTCIMFKSNFNTM